MKKASIIFLSSLILLLLVSKGLTFANDNNNRPQNHGFFVSTEAHEHEGGAEVSAVAKSDIGKNHDKNEVKKENKDEDEHEKEDEDENDDEDEIILSPTPSSTPSVTPTISPSISPSVTPSVTPIVTPSITPSVTPSLTPPATPSPMPEFQVFIKEKIKGEFTLNQIILFFENILNSLKSSLGINNPV